MDSYRAMITRDNGAEEDWGFFDLRILDSGTVAMRTLEVTPATGYDTFLAPGTWRQIDDAALED